MKTLQNLILMIALVTQVALAGNAAKEITIEYKKIDHVGHWMPEKVYVSPGEQVKFVVRHDEVGGPDSHEFSIPVLKISERVDRGQPRVIPAGIPNNLATGDYPIECPTHKSKHVSATLVVRGVGK